MAAPAPQDPGDAADRGTLAALPWVVFGAALAVFAFTASGGPGWSGAAADALFAAALERPASAPLYGIAASAAEYLLPVGEPGFRLAALNAVLGAVALLGVMRAARALLPRDPMAGVVAAVLLALAPPFRDAVAAPGPAVLAACGAVWAVAFALAAARPGAGASQPLRALACVGVTLGAAPWLGALLLFVIGAWLARSRESRAALVAGAAGLGALAVVLWIGAVGALPGAAPDAAAVVLATGRGAAGVLVGAGLLGAAFAAATRLPAAGWLAAAIALAAGHSVIVSHEAVVPLALLAVGAAVVPAAVSRAAAVAGAAGATLRRHAVALAAGVPLVGVALGAGTARSAEDAGDEPARLATELIGDVPPGPGVFAATRAPAELAIGYAQLIAGARPDLQLAPPLDAVAVDAMRRGLVAGADTPAFGRLDPRLSLPRGRGFQLFNGPPPAASPPLPPPGRYRTEAGVREEAALSLARARYEGSHLRLDLAARAAGLLDRFRAADLALLSVAAPTRARPALFGFVPPLGGPPGGRWRLELFGDDLAWVAGLPQPEASWPPERALHALWRKLWRGEIAVTDPAIGALGLPAVLATLEMLEALRSR